VVRRRRSPSEKKVATFNGQHVNPTFNMNGIEDPYARLPFQDDGVINTNNDDEYRIPENNLNKNGNKSTKRLITNDYDFRDARPYVSSSLTRPTKPVQATSKKALPASTTIEPNIYSASYDSEPHTNLGKENQGLDAGLEPNTYSTIGEYNGHDSTPTELSEYASIDDLSKKLRVDVEKPGVNAQHTRAPDNAYEVTKNLQTNIIEPQRKAPSIPVRRDLTERRESADNDSNTYDTTKRPGTLTSADNLYDKTKRPTARPRLQSRSGVPRSDANQYETISSRGFRNPGYESAPVSNESPYDHLDR